MAQSFVKVEQGLVRKAGAGHCRILEGGAWLIGRQSLSKEQSFLGVQGFAGEAGLLKEKQFAGGQSLVGKIKFFKESTS